MHFSRTAVILLGTFAATFVALPSFAGEPLAFSLTWQLEAGASSFGVSLGDIDLDGDLDIYIADIDGKDRLWLNDGMGSFTRSPQMLDGGLGALPILAPLDADPFPDLWLARHLTPSAVYLNDGNGVLSFDQSYGAAQPRRGSALGDLDGDGDLDAFSVTDIGTSPAEVLLNDGMGGFTDSGQALDTGTSRSVALGDVDGDGDLDAVVGTLGNSSLSLNDGSGVFTLGAGGPDPGDPFGHGLGDLDGDGDLDAFFANGRVGGSPNEVWLNDGTGQFVDSGQELGDDYSFSVALADFNGDGDLDAVVGNNSSLPNRAWVNDGSGIFQDAGVELGIGAALGVAAGDLDGDGRPDLVIANGKNPDQVFFNRPPGVTFVESEQLLGSNQGVDVALGDLDGDGWPDAALATAGGITRVLLGDGAGGFVDSHQWLGHAGGDSNSALALGDVDGDGDLDIYVGNTIFSSEGEGKNRVWLNDGAGDFEQSPEIWIGSTSTSALALGDIDGDGDLDLVNGNSGTGENRVWRGDGAGGFTMDPVIVGVAERGSSAVVLGDLDGDLDLDLVIGSLFEVNQIFFNDGTGTFVESGQTLPLSDTLSLALGDVDGDGDLDMWEGNSLDTSVLWLNDGAGFFSDSGQVLGDHNVEVELVDIDFDGDLDAFTTTGGLPLAGELWLGDGAGHFTLSNLSFGNCRGLAGALCDFDADLVPDIFMVCEKGDHRSWINLVPGPAIFEDGFESGDTSAWDSIVPSPSPSIEVTPMAGPAGKCRQSP